MPSHPRRHPRPVTAPSAQPAVLRRPWSHWGPTLGSETLSLQVRAGTGTVSIPVSPTSKERPPELRKRRSGGLLHVWCWWTGVNLRSPFWTPEVPQKSEQRLGAVSVPSGTHYAPPGRTPPGARRDRPRRGTAPRGGCRRAVRTIRLRQTAHRRRHALADTVWMCHSAKRNRSVLGSGTGASAECCRARSWHR